MFDISDIAFVVISIFTVLTAIIALEAKELVYGAMALAASFLGVAGFFVLLDASFLAMLQILVFIGAIAVLLLFTVMLVRREKWTKLTAGIERPVGAIAAILLATGIIVIGFLSGLDGWMPIQSVNLSFVDIGNQLILQYWPALQILAVVLGAAVIGGLTMAKLEKNSEDRT